MYDYGLANGTGHADPGIYGAAMLDAQLTDGRLAEDSAYVQGRSTRHQLAIDSANAKIKFQRTMPHYSRLKPNHVVIARKAADQFK